MKKKLLLFIFLFSIQYLIDARELHVGAGQEYATLAAAATNAKPGDAIIIHNGIYTQREDISNLHGEKDNPIIIYAEEEGEVIYTGQSEAWHLSSCTHLFIYGFVFEKQTSNGVNIDDSGHYDSSTYDITIKNCLFKDMDASGNNDMLKLSGLDDFSIEECSFVNGADGGSGIDMVGCHGGSFIKNSFENMGSNCIQVKGGSQHIEIVQNTFKNGGRRSLNLGGSTGLEYFRPHDAPFEAADILVSANIFIGSWAPIAYVGSTRVNVVNNTFYKPENWVFRILQETVDTSRFVPCSNNTFSNNIIYFGNSLHRIVNIGPNTKPETFSFENNLWYNFEDSGFNNPNLPAPESNSIIQQNPLFVEADSFDFELKPESPAISKGTRLFISYRLDFKDRYLKEPCSLGANEYKGIFKDFTGNISTKWYYDYSGKNGNQSLICKEKVIKNNKEMKLFDYSIDLGDGSVDKGQYLFFTHDHKVIYKEREDSDFFTLYDFNLKKGDMLYSTSNHYGDFITRIDSVKFEYLSNEVRKVLITTPIIILDLGYDQAYFGKKGKIVEGIGSLKSFLLGNPYENNFHNMDSLRCFSYFNNEGIEFKEKFVDYECNTAISKTYESIFGSISTQWNITGGNLWGTTTDKHKVIGDTLIHGKEYRIIAGYSISDYYGFLREDMEQGKVWYRNNQDDREYVVLDLSLEVGDSIYIGGNWNVNPGYFHVDSVFEVDGRKHIRFDLSYPYYLGNKPFTMIEGVVSNMGFRFQDNTYWRNFGSYLLCSYKNGIKVYGTEPCTYDDTGVSDIDKKNIKIDIRPNPARDYISLSFENNFTGIISIYSITGTKIMEDSVINTSNKRLNLVNLKKGSYFLIAKGSSGISVKRFVIL